MSRGAATALYALLGHPVRRSLSPRMHNAWFGRLGVDAVYVALEVDPARAAEVGPAIRALGLAGANLTVPLKEAVLASLDAVEGSVSHIGAANVVVREGGRLVGANTDAPGFVRAFVEEHGEVGGRTALVLGAGGAGRAAAWGLASAGAERVVLLNRTEPRAREAAERMGRGCRTRFDVDLLGEEGWARHVGEADIVVVATSGSAADVGAGWSVDRLREGVVVCDLNYWSAAPPLLEAARRRGLAVQDGLPMLVHQAALAFARWTGRVPDAGAMLAELRAAGR